MRSACLVVLGLIGSCAALNLRRKPSDVEKDSPCYPIWKSTQAACEALPYGASNDACNYATCYTADLNRERCADVITTGVPGNVKFPDDLDRVMAMHGIVCSDIRNAAQDCDTDVEGKVRGDFEKIRSGGAFVQKPCHKKH